MQDQHQPITENDVRRIVAEEVAKRLRAAPTSSTLCSQYDGERPAGVGKALYLKVHQLAFRNGEPSAVRRGKSRVMSHDAFDKYERQLRKPTATVLPLRKAPMSVDDEVLAELGGRRR